MEAKIKEKKRESKDRKGSTCRGVRCVRHLIQRPCFVGSSTWASLCGEWTKPSANYSFSFVLLFLPLLLIIIIESQHPRLQGFESPSTVILLDFSCGHPPLPPLFIYLRFLSPRWQSTACISNSFSTERFVGREISATRSPISFFICQHTNNSVSISENDRAQEFRVKKGVGSLNLETLHHYIPTNTNSASASRGIGL